jgi:hypothetical protein
MKRKLHQLLFMIVFMPMMALAQLPTYHSGTPTANAPGTGTFYPFGYSATGARFQTYYTSGAFGNNLPALVPITRLYFYADTIVADTVTYSSIIINMGEYPVAPGINLTAGWLPTPNNLTQVLNVANYMVKVDSGWFAIDLQVPYLYNSNHALFIDIGVDIQTPFVKQWRVRTGPGGAGFKSAPSQLAVSPTGTTIGNSSIPAMGLGLYTGVDNASLATVVLPSVCATFQDAMVKLVNSGSNVLNSVNIDWTINGIPQGSIVVNGPIDTFGSAKNDTLITLGNVSFLTGPQYIKAWTSSPNNNSDPFTFNDTVSFMMSSALNGTYDVGPGHLYPTITSAVEALYTFGVCGPVTFLVDTGVYTEQVYMFGRINGASATNPVVFQGVDKDKTVVSWSALAVDSKHVIRLRNVAHVTFRDLTIKPTGTTNAWGVHLQDSCNKVSIKNCLIDLSSAGASTGQENTVGIAVTGPTTSLCIPGPCAAPINQPSRADSLEIDSNTILYGYQGITITGNATLNKGRHNKITNNVILNTYQRGINLTQQENVIVSNNTIVPRLSGVANTGVGIFCTGVFSLSNTPQTIINGNKIYQFGTAGISINTSENTSNNQDDYNKGLIINNMIGGYAQLAEGNGIYINESKNWVVAHNTIHHDYENTTAVTAGPIRLVGSNTSNVSIWNNILSVSKNGAALPVHAAVASNIDSMDANVFYRYNMSNGEVLHIGGTTYTQTNYKGGGGYNTNSGIAAVPFLNDTSLYPQSTCGLVPGIPLSYVPTDIDSNARSLTSPIVGASESSPLDYNIAIVKLLGPSSPITAGTHTLKLLVQNYGSNPINSVSISYQLNNDFPVTQAYSFNNPLNPCDTQTIEIQGLILTANDTLNQFIVYTSYPNTLDDMDKSNDTVKTSLYAPLDGVYTLGGAGADFATFADAAVALRTAGIKGAVTFMVNQGNYIDQLNISGPIAGLSQSNTITFDGVDKSTRSISFAGTAAAPHTIKIDGVKYVTIKNLSVLSTGTTWGHGIHITGNSNAAKIKNCNIQIIGTGATSTSSNFIAINVSGAIITTGVRIDSLEIDSNVITAGYYGVNLYASSGAANIGQFNKIRYNTFNDNQQYAVYLYYQQTPQVIGNTIKCRGANAGVGIYMNFVTTPVGAASSTKIIGNRIWNHGGAGISVNSCTNASNSNKGLIANNVIGGGDRVAGTYGLYLNSSTNWAIVHNTINRDFANTTNANAAALRIQGSASASFGNSIINNILSISGAGAALPLYTQAVGNTDTVNYNLYYRADTFSTNTIVYIGSNVTINAFKTGNFNRNSVFYVPGFVSNLNLEPNVMDSSVWSSNGRGMYVPYIAYDFNNNLRPQNRFKGVPDIGAHEFTPLAHPPMATAHPDTIIGGTIQTYVFATDTVAQIAWPSYYNGASNVEIRQYSGEIGPQKDTLYNYMHFYVGTSTFPVIADSMMLFYRDNWLGTHLAEDNIKAIQNDSGGFIWAAQFAHANNPAKNVITTYNYYNFSSYTYHSGSDELMVIPVKLISFTGTKDGRDVQLLWSTANEKNASVFMVERSFDHKTWENIQQVKAKGNSNVVTNYSCLDINPFSQADKIYYRLKMLDFDGEYEYSKIIEVNTKASVNNDVFLYPNPFNTILNVAFDMNEHHILDVVIYDITGKEINMPVQFETNKHDNLVTLNGLERLESGIYFISISLDGGKEPVTKKIIKL